MRFLLRRRAAWYAALAVVTLGVLAALTGADPRWRAPLLIVTAFALWNPENLGYLAGYAVSALANGTITGKVGEKFKAGKLGSYTIIKGPDGKPQVILGPPFTFTIKNVDKFNF